MVDSIVPTLSNFFKINGIEHLRETYYTGRTKPASWRKQQLK